MASKHARKHEVRPPRVEKKKFRLDSNDFGFICAGVSNVSIIKGTFDMIWVVCYKLTAIWAPTKNRELDDLGFIPFRFSFLFKKCDLRTLSCDFAPHN